MMGSSGNGELGIETVLGALSYVQSCLSVLNNDNCSLFSQQFSGEDVVWVSNQQEGHLAGQQGGP